MTELMAFMRRLRSGMKKAPRRTAPFVQNSLIVLALTLT
jgi:hypothetical protein